MSQYKRRSTKGRRKQQEATIVGDLFRILFAVSMLVVAILVAFFVMKNLTGFSLPDLKQTLMATEAEENSPAVQTEETKKITITESSREVTVAETEVMESESEMEDDRTEEAEEVTEESLQEEKETIQEERDPVESETKTEREETNAPTEPHSVQGEVRETEAIYESPVIQGGDFTQSLGPGFDVEIGNGPVSGGNP